jgi:hypothetical protein
MGCSCTKPTATEQMMSFRNEFVDELTTNDFDWHLA